MTASQRKKMESVMHNGQIVATVSNPNKPGVTARFYANMESRGYKTGFQYKMFFYIVRLDNGLPFDVRGIGNAPARRTMRDYWDSHPADFHYSITDESLFLKMIA